MREFRDKVTVITGAANGIGAALAQLLADEGCKLALMDIESESLEALAASLTARGADVMTRSFDIADWDATEAFAADVLARFGTINMVIANAGVTLVGRPTAALSINDWRWVMGTNVYGVVHSVQAFLPTLMGQPDSHIVITASGVCSFAGISANAPYCASKAAVISYAETLYRELAETTPPVSVTALCPGTTIATLDRSESRRPAHLPDLAKSDPVSPAFRAMLEQIRDKGLTAQNVAKQTLAAIREDRFYVITHPENGAVAAARGNDAQEARNPALQLF